MSGNVKECANNSGCGSGCGKNDQSALQQCMARIKHKIIVMSGKGGVGKSTVAVNLAVALSMAGKRVGLLDVDIHGPSIPTMLHLTHEKISTEDNKILPVCLGELKVMSIGFMLQDHDDAVIWRGPMKMGVIKQFLSEVEWGDLDYLVIDSPPGTGDEPLSVCQLIEKADGAVIVTTPQEVAAADVRKSIDFCLKLNLPVLGIVENMSGFACPDCGKVTEIFNSGAGQIMADKFGLCLLGKIPLDPAICNAGDSGRPFIYHLAKTATAKAFESVIAPILALSEKEQSKPNHLKQEKNTMKIALPLAAGKLCMHFGHCEQFMLIDVDEPTRKITGKTTVTPPPHEPGLLPRWLAEQGVTNIIAGGMGQRAQTLFQERNIAVVVGAPAGEPETLVTDYLSGSLVSGANACDH